MPFPNEHAARIIDPAKCDEKSFRRKTVAPGVDIIMGKKIGEDTMTAQSYRFSKETFTVSEAKKWLKDHAVNNIDFEEASGEEKMKLVDVVEMEGVQVARIGKFKNGKADLSPENLQMMVENFNEKIAEPYLNLDHDEKFTDNVKRALKVVSLGFVSSLYMAGDRLMASFKQVPRKVAELIKSGMLKQRSIEYYPKFELNGKEYKNVLTAVSFFGADIPAVNALSDDFNVLLKSAENAITPADSENKSVKIIFQKEKEMEKVEVTKQEYDELITLRKTASESEAVVVTMDKELVSLKAEKETLTQEVVNLKKENETLKSFKTEAEKNAATGLHKTAEAFVDKAITDGKILAKYKASYVADYIAKSSTPDMLKLFTEDVENRTKVINLGEMKHNPVVGKVDLKKATSDEIQEAIEAIMTRDNCTWAEARKKIEGGK